MIIETNTPQETFCVGKKIGENARPGQIYTLTGDLGVGKTIFTQGFAEGLGIDEPVNSPTFTIVSSMIQADCRYTILTYTVSGISVKWMRSDMRTVFMEKAYA